MAVVPLFDAANWLRTRLRGGDLLAPDTLGCLSSLAVMFLVLDATTDAGAGDFGPLERAAGRIDPGQVSAADAAAIGQFAAYWKEQFGSAGGIRAYWMQRSPGDPAVQAALDRFFASATATLQDQALGLLLVAPYIRASLLVQAKSAAALNEQLVNLDIAAQSIATVLQAAKLTPLVR